jgi:hypothetical protein
VSGTTESKGWTKSGYETNYRDAAGYSNGFLAKIRDGILFAPQSGIGYWSNPSPWITSPPNSATTLILMLGSTLVVNVPNAQAGLISILNGSTLNVQNGSGLTTAGPVFNQGSLNVQSGGTLSLGPGPDANGAALVQVDGTATIGGTLFVRGTSISNGVVNLQGGTLKGSGVIAGSLVVNGGVISPGNSPGTLAITSNFTQTVSGALRLELAGPAAGQFDQLKVGGTAQLGGTLDLELVDGFIPALGARFPLLSCGNLTGTFDNVHMTAGLSLAYSTTNVILVVTGTVPVQLSQIVVSEGKFVFSFPTLSNRSYTVQVTDNLATNQWQLFTNVTGNGARFQVLTPLNDAPHRFFRVRQPL